MREKSESGFHSKWFTIGMAISLSAATFASPIGTSMDQPWHSDSSGKNVPIDYRFGYDSSQKQSKYAWVETSKIPWSGPWWWTFSGSIAIRWRDAERDVEAGRTDNGWPSWDSSDVMTYSTYSASDLASMSEDEIREKLSPAEKLDVVSGHADPSRGDYYSNLAGVRSWARGIIRKYPEEAGYHGLCHGFSHASIWLPEPQAVIVPVTYTIGGVRKTIRVGFGSGDLKALATYYYGQRTFEESSYQAAMIGSNGNGMNPAALHLLLTNMIGKDNQSFVIDTSPSDAVWNYPVAGYNFTSYASGPVRSNDADPRAVKEVYVSTDIHFMGTSNPTQDPRGASANKFLEVKRYEYRLELTSDDQIVGGSWASGSDRTDFAWTLKGKIPFTGDYSFLERAWKAAPRN